MKSTGLLQLDDNLQQAGKVHNLQHVCGVSGCVMPNNIVLTTFNIFVLSVLLSLVPTASNSIVYPSSPNNIVTTILSRHDKTTMPNNIVLTTFNIFVLSVLLSLVPTASNSIVYPSSPNNIVTTILSRHDKTTMSNNIVLTTFNIVVLSVLLSPCSNNVEQHCSSIKSEQYCYNNIVQQCCFNSTVQP